MSNVDSLAILNVFLVLSNLALNCREIKVKDPLTLAQSLKIPLTLQEFYCRVYYFKDSLILNQFLRCSKSRISFKNTINRETAFSSRIF